ncbi:peptidase M16 [Aphanothece hegewaldii CCALA 016]|uniref:Peptidase M16 n=1 Tax=Aphanothece hegewaldii CCALA 016 TaxID=2107694 RepID=A0A2T1LSC4_9CHRO|nr:pitrilysin family protein [Aphanothece hegewaldii]PSF32661.1 peptidase M16 [Aphanothece hegewaldii CCALA 016]
MRFLRTLFGLAMGVTLMMSSWGLFSSFAYARSELTVAQGTNPYLEKAIERVTEFTLDNGLKFIVMENREAPVVSFFTYANVGGVDEPDGKTGVAHFLEHLAFKGTKDIGTTDYQAEKAILDRQDEIYAQLQAAKKAGKVAEVKQLSQEFDKITAQTNQFVKQNEFGQIVERSGGVGLNAATSADATVYFYSFPSNKLELWMSLESERFLEPVFREFYKEKEVILEERRLRTDNNPVGQMIEAFIDKAFTEHPYKRPVIGYDEDIRNLSREDVTQFFREYYPPNNLTIAIVGDVDPAKVKELAKIYFGRYTAKPKPKENITVEPKQTQPREVDLTLPSQPWYFVGYHRPQLNHPDNAIYEVMTTIMSNGRTSRLYRSLVEEKQIALVAQGFNGFPGDKYPNLIVFYAMTSPNGTLEEVSQALNQEIERLKTEPVSEQELQRAKNQLRAQLLRTLNSNSGMAQALAEYDVKTGSWRNLFTQIDEISAVTAEDIQRVANQTFSNENRTIGRIKPAQ